MEAVLTNARVVGALGRRSIFQAFRRPQFLAPILLYAALQAIVPDRWDPLIPPLLLVALALAPLRLVPAMAASEVMSQWPDAIARGELLLLDAGRLTPSEPSTVVDCMGRHPRVIRPGAIAARVLRETVPSLIGDA